MTSGVKMRIENNQLSSFFFPVYNKKKWSEYYLLTKIQSV